MSKILWGFTLGLVTGLLLAPEKGSETRQRISRRASELKDKFNDFVDSVTEKFDSFKDDAESMKSSISWLKNYPSTTYFCSRNDLYGRQCLKQTVLRRYKNQTLLKTAQR